MHHWTGWTRHFGPLSGTDPKLDDPVTRYVILAFGQGCNLGFTQTAKHLRNDVSAHELSFVNRRHVTATRIDQALVDLINAYHQCALPKLWGSGKTAAADGTKIEIYRENLFSEYHLRYGGYGGIAYYHISEPAAPGRGSISLMDSSRIARPSSPMQYMQTLRGNPQRSSRWPTS